MTKEQKKEIKTLLEGFVSKFPSQAKAVQKIGVAEGTIINMRKDNWKSISDDMWRKVGKKIGYAPDGGWQLVPTVDFNTLITLFDDAKQYSNVYSIVSPAGTGKSETSKWYRGTKRNVYRILCADYFNKKVFLSKILKEMGKDGSGTVAEMMDDILETLIRQEAPLLILDEVDKLNDNTLYFIITLYNILQDKCGIVLLSTSHLSKKITRGLRLNKKGYEEIYSRIGRRFISLPGTEKSEVEKICEVNGVTDPVAITSIYNEYEGDLRRVKRAVHKYKRQTEAQPA